MEKEIVNYFAWNRTCLACHIIVYIIKLPIANHSNPLNSHLNYQPRLFTNVTEIKANTQTTFRGQTEAIHFVQWVTFH